MTKTAKRVLAHNPDQGCFMCPLVDTHTSQLPVCWALNRFIDKHFEVAPEDCPLRSGDVTVRATKESIWV